MRFCIFSYFKQNLFSMYLFINNMYFSQPILPKVFFKHVKYSNIYSAKFAISSDYFYMVVPFEGNILHKHTRGSRTNYLILRLQRSSKKANAHNIVLFACLLHLCNAGVKLAICQPSRIMPIKSLSGISGLLPTLTKIQQVREDAHVFSVRLPVAPLYTNDNPG